jgi:DNA primase
MIKFYDWFSKYIPDLKPDVEQQNVICIFHEDTQESLSINLEKGLYFCHGCGEKGDIYSLVMKQEHLSFMEAKRKILGDARVSVLSEAEVEEAHRLLMSKTHLQDMLFQHRNWLPDTLERFKLGWNDREKRVTIPIYNEYKQLVNIRKYLVVGKPTNKNPKFIGIRGHNDNYFFPIENLITKDEQLSKFVLLCAGEPDTILACQYGFNAGTFTAGEGKFNRDLLPLFKEKLVYICYDKDIAGTRALRLIGPELAKFAKEVKVIDLPFGG